MLKSKRDETNRCATIRVLQKAIIESYVKSREQPSTNELLSAREHIKLRADRHVMQNVKKNCKMIATMRYLCACLYKNGH